MKKPKKNKSHFHLECLGYGSPRPHPPRIRPLDWSWSPPPRQEPRPFKSKRVPPKVKPAITPTMSMAAEWELFVPVSAPRLEPATKSPAEARLRGVSKTSVNTWRAE